MFRVEVRALLLAIWFTTLACVQCAGAEPIPQRVHVVSADQNESTRLILEAFRKRFPAAAFVSSTQLASAKQPGDIYLAVGPVALRAIVDAQVDGVTISVFTANLAFREIVESLPPSRAERITAIYADPSPVDQLRLVRAIYRRSVPVAVLLSPRAAHLGSTLRQAASEAEVDIAIEEATTDKSINRALNRVANNPVLLAIPDSTLYNSETLRNVLITTYRHDQAVIGFSASVVKAGALATTFTQIDDMVAQTSELIAEFAATGKLPSEQYPKYFEIAVNENVARSLNLTIDAEVKRLSRKPPVRPQ